MASFTTEQLLHDENDVNNHEYGDVEDNYNPDMDQYEDVLLNEDEEEEEKCIILADTSNTGESTKKFNNNNGDEYDDSEDNKDEEEEKYPTFKQVDFIFDQHTSFWEDDIVPAAVLSFLFLLCGLISYLGYENEFGGNRFTATVGSFSIWSAITLIFILFHGKKSERDTNKQLMIKNTSEYNEDDYKPYYSDDEDDDGNGGYQHNMAPR
mmetsp:Transcript_69404/g.62267  ORF Transcript_69404/g.62267 Transcript_69404/m.62267 type:complete len:209 (+) Transcript_69404:31-657(+)